MPDSLLVTLPLTKLIPANTKGENFWFEKKYFSRTERESFHVYRAAYLHKLGPVRLNEEQVNEQWLSREELEAVYRKRRELISAPLLMTCKHILGFEDEKEHA